MPNRRVQTAVLASNGRYWTAVFYDAAGVRRWKSLGSKAKISKLEARRRCLELAARLLADPEHSAGHEVRSVRRGPTLDEALRTHQAVMAPRWAATTRSKNRAIGAGLIRSFGGGRLVATIGVADAEDWRSALETSGVSGHTVAMHVRGAKALFAHLVRRGLVRTNPFAAIPSADPPSGGATWTLPTDRAVEELVKDLEGPVKALAALCAYAGLRRSEALRLAWRDVDLEGRRLRVTGKASSRNAPDRVREVLIEPRLEAVLRATPSSSSSPVIEIHDLRRTLARAFAGRGLGPHPMRLLRRWRDSTWRSLYPGPVVDSWMGHSLAVARRYYYQVPAHYYTSSPPRGSP